MSDNAKPWGGSKKLLNPEQRKEVGFLVTLVRGDEERTMHVTGPRKASLREVAELCDREGWLVQSLSTPESILRDLQGSRQYAENARRKAQDALALTESSMLGGIGRVDLFVGR